MSISTQILPALIKETERRLFEESVPRIKKCLSLVTEEEVWYAMNEEVNSIGNLILHLNGNVRQWILSGLLGQVDVRRRQLEFDAIAGYNKSELEALLDALELDIRAGLAKVKPEELLRLRPVQVYEETGLTILIHVIEHFSYHVGQITYIVKSLKGIDTQYYGGINLENQLED